jgi:S-DNA-T family DNA segregation ATPase FtsK/SpoIIIE
MKTFSRLFNPTSNRRLNELVGFLLCVSALLLFLALASYSPLDPSFNSASVLTTVRGARNWIGIVGAVLSDLCLQGFGVGAFLLPVFPALLGARWFRSRKVQSPVAKSLGGFWLLIFVPAFLALLPGQVRWLGVIPMEGLVGRIVGDFLIHYLNLAGAYIVCATVLAVALYLSTAFSFSTLQVWIPTRFAFVFALRDRWRDWREEHTKRRMQRELDKRRASKPVVTAQLIPGRTLAPAPEQRAGRPLDSRQGAAATVATRTGIERMMGSADEEPKRSATPELMASPGAASAGVPRTEAGVVPEVSERAIVLPHKTTPRIAEEQLCPAARAHRRTGNSR